MTRLEVLTKDQMAHLIPVRPIDSYKHNFGRVLLIGGNTEMGGAIQMAAQSCVNTGAGLTTVATDPVNVPAIHAVLPEAMVCDWADVNQVNSQMVVSDIITIGPGMGLDKERWQTISQQLNHLSDSKIVILDADVLTLLAEDLRMDKRDYLSQHQVILTPHLGEWSRLVNQDIDPNDNQAIQDWVDIMGLNLVLKSEQTRIFTPASTVIYQNKAGNPGMAIGGMGDTLAGMISATCGQMDSLVEAISLAIFLHSYIGDLMYADHYIVRPQELARRIPQTMKALQQADR